MLDLIEVGYICSFQKEDQTLYQVTESGRRTLDLTLDLLPGIIKLKADTNLKPIMNQDDPMELRTSEKLTLFIFGIGYGIGLFFFLFMIALILN